MHDELSKEDRHSDMLFDFVVSAMLSVAEVAGKHIVRNYPPDLHCAAVDLMLQQAQALGESWAA